MKKLIVILIAIVFVTSFFGTNSAIAQYPTNTPTPTSVPCQVTTVPSVYNMNIGDSNVVTAGVTSGLGGATVVSMSFGSYDTSVATVNPAVDSSKPYQTTVTAVGGGASAVWATATLSDSRTCQTTGGTDTNINVAGPTATPTPTPTPVPVQVFGRHVDINGSDLVLPGQNVTVSGPSGTFSSASTPSFNFNFPSQPGIYTVTAANIAGYTTSNFYAKYQGFWFGPYGPYTPGNSFTVDLVPGDQVDVRFKYTVYCEVTTNPPAISMNVGDPPQTVSADVTTGLNGATITRMDFGSYDTGVATVNPTFDLTSLFQTQVTPVGGGLAGIWATATLSDGRVCQSTASTDTDATISGPTSTPTPTATPTNTPTPTSVPPGVNSVSGIVYVDDGRGGGTAGNGIQDGGEIGYPSGATVTVPGYPGVVTNGSGNYTINGIANGSWHAVLTVPAGYGATTPNPTADFVLPPNYGNANFGIQLIPPPACSGGVNAISAIPDSPINPGNGTTLSVTSCTNADGVPPFTWNPDTNNYNPAPSLSGQTDRAISSTVNWTAPLCPLAQRTYRSQVTVKGSGGSTVYTKDITVPATYSVTVNIRKIVGVGACDASAGSAYANSVNVNLSGGSLPPGGTTQPTATGQTIFACLQSGNYTATLAVPSGYTLIGINGGAASGQNGISLGAVAADKTVSFCIAAIDPWFQVDTGDVRVLNLSNPVPSGLKASTDPTYPGIFYSSNNNANFGDGVSSNLNWKIDNEYASNANTQNRNGGMSYDYYKSKANQEGTTITTIDDGPLNASQISASGVYEVKTLAQGGSGNITSLVSPLTITGKHIVLLVSGDVTIDQPITVTQGNGLLVIAAKGNIHVDKTIGTDVLTSTASQIDGIFTAQGSIVLDGDTCSAGVSDKRLNVGGVLIANSLKPFSTTGVGTLQNKRSLCANRLSYPSLYIASRPDFVTQLTDFYKTSYSKWQEVNP